MRIEISGRLAARHDELARLIVIGVRGIRSDDVEVHVRSRPPWVRHIVRYDEGLDAFAPDTRRLWLADHPGATSIPVARVFTRARDAAVFAGATGGHVERRVDDRVVWRLSGRAFEEIPAVARVASTTRYLVTLRVPARLERLEYPKTLQYHRGGVPMKTAPAIEVRSWPEELVHLVAHEAYHTQQFRHHMRASEVAAERWAAKAVRRFRASCEATDGAIGA